MSLLRSWINSQALSSALPRSSEVVSDHSLKAVSAASTACRTSSSEPLAAWSTTWPVAGLRTS